MAIAALSDALAASTAAPAAGALFANSESPEAEPAEKSVAFGDSIPRPQWAFESLELGQNLRSSQSPFGPNLNSPIDPRPDFDLGLPLRYDC